jgi:hypothetical protein
MQMCGSVRHNSTDILQLLAQILRNKAGTPTKHGLAACKNHHSANDEQGSLLQPSTRKSMHAHAGLQRTFDIK